MTLINHIKENQPNAYKELLQWKQDNIKHVRVMTLGHGRMKFHKWPNEMTLIYLMRFLIEKQYTLSVSKLCPEHIQAIIQSGFEDYEKIIEQTMK